jgi:hypothetical protein
VFLGDNEDGLIEMSSDESCFTDGALQPGVWYRSSGQHAPNIHDKKGMETLKWLLIIYMSSGFISWGVVEANRWCG